MATFEQRNPYVNVTPRLAKKTSRKRLMGLLDTSEQDTGLLGESSSEDDKVAYDQGLLQDTSQQSVMSNQELYKLYMDAMQEQQDAKDEKAFKNAAIKTGKHLAGESQYSDIGPETGTTLAAGENAYGATTTPINFNDAGITTTTYDGSGAQIGETTTSSGTGSSGSSSGGSYLGAVTGALGGYGRGVKNYYTDPKMRSGEDGFGKYHHDARAEVGGGVLGGVIGYFAPYLSGVTGPIVEAVHPYAEEITRNAINAGDTLGGVTGAMLFDPIGAMASGKYSKKDLALSGLLAPLGPLNMLNSGSDTVRDLARNPSPSNIGRKIGDFFGW